MRKNLVRSFLSMVMAAAIAARRRRVKELVAPCVLETGIDDVKVLE